MSSPSPVAAFLFFLFLSGAANYIALKRGFYRLSERESFPLAPKYPLWAFGIYLLSSLIIAPIIYLGLALKYSDADHSWKEVIKTLPPVSQAVIQMIFIGWLFLAFLFYLRLIPKNIVQQILTGKNAFFADFFKNFQLGALTWLISYPTVLLVNHLSSMVSQNIWGKQQLHQVAVELLKKIKGYPVHFALLTFLVAVIVPFLEELIFRGFLQSYLRSRWGVKKSLFSVAALFALFHFSIKQGTGNFELIISLFVLGLYLGFLYERQRSLWAPFGLHFTFNIISALGIWFAK